MALSSRRATDNLVRIFQQKFGITIQGEGRQYLEAIYEAMIQEIKANLEAEGVESPSAGYTVTVPDGAGSITVSVQGISVTGKVPKGKFR
jgi:hypothetical protein